MNYPSRETVIEQLQLEAHLEGGHFKRSFQADHREKIATDNGPRYTLTSIYYLLSAESPVGHWHLNQSDIIHYFHLGSPIDYYLIHADGNLTTATLGPDLAAGQQLQLTVRGGTWKASHLATGDYGLISEAVAPGFDYEDMSIAKRRELIAVFPQHRSLIEAYT
ncbi:MAG: cupin domain-containing protein [Halioglobus sp.]